MPPDMYLALAIWFAIWSMAIAAKSPNISSTTGRPPTIAAPSPAPVKPASEIGVSRMRSSPNSSSMPLVTVKMPPIGPTSSPIMNTRPSARISSDSASRRASACVSSLDIYILQCILRQRPGLLNPPFLSFEHLVCSALEDTTILLFVQYSCREQALSHHLQRAELLPGLKFTRRAVVSGITRVVPEPAIALALDKARPLAFSGTLGSARHGIVDGEYVCSVNARLRESRRPLPCPLCQ